MPSAWLGLLSNFAILFLPVFAWVQLHLRTRIAERPMQAALFGGVIGVGAVLSMLTPFEIEPGVFVDARAAGMATAGFFGGPIAGATAVVIAAAVRIWLGGTGAVAGTALILIAGIVGILGSDMLAGRERRRSHVALLAITVAAAGTLSILLLPQQIWPLAFSTVALPSAVVSMIATSVLGLLLIGEERRQELLRTNLVYRKITEALPDSLNVKDLDGRFIAANPATAALMRAPDEQALIGKTDFDFYPPETASRFRREEIVAAAEGQPVPLEQRVEHADGTGVWLSTLKVPLKDAAGQIVGLITLNRDITARKSLEEKLTRSQTLLSAALAHMADGIVMFDADRRLAFCNEQYRRFFSATADVRLSGARLRDILRVSVERGEQAGVSPDGLDAWATGVEASLDVAGDRIMHLSSGRWLNARTRPLRQGGCLIVFTDITTEKQAQDALAETNRRLAELAATDGLTGLANRRAFDEALKRGAADTEDTRPLSLLLVDLDRFKQFNDSYGHLAGDECLRSVAACLRSAMRRKEDLAARYGGEELAAVLPGADAEGARAIAERFRTCVARCAIPHRASEKGTVTVSIGIATMPAARRPLEPEALVLTADRALYIAKSAGRDRIEAADGGEAEAGSEEPAPGVGSA